MKGRITEAAEPIVRVCIMRDAICPHGFDCPYVGDGPMGYPCKDGWRNPPTRLSNRSQEGRDAD